MAAPLREAKAVKPGRKAAISPSRDRVPSGKTNTISPRFNRRNDSLMPPRPIPSRSIGMASSELISQPERREPEEGVAGQVVHPPRNPHADQRRIEMALVIGNDQDPTAARDILAAVMPHPIGEDAAKLQAAAKKLVPDATS